MKIHVNLVRLVVAQVLLVAALAASGENRRDVTYPPWVRRNEATLPALTPDVLDPMPAEAQAPPQASDTGCGSCHLETDEPSMHSDPRVKIGCADCHGGDPSVALPGGTEPRTPAYEDAKQRAHVPPRDPESWTGRRAGADALLNESPEFVRFVNPGDLRVAPETCGPCHAEIVQAARTSLMATSATLWGGVLYNNGILPNKRYILGEGYTRDGEPVRIQPTPDFEMSEELLREGVLAGLEPRVRGETARRVTWFMGANRNPGDFRSSGCSSCHVVYANDRDPIHSGGYAKYGHWGRSASADPTIRDLSGPDSTPERGHPIQHAFTRAIPTSQCMSCHMQRPSMFLNSYLGYTTWDYESDAPLIWPERQRDPSIEQIWESKDVGGSGSEPEFLSRVWEDVNPVARDTQFADYHGQGGNFRAVFKRARDGTLLDAEGLPVSDTLPPEEKWKRAVHLRDSHADAGMQCTDCHFSQDNHGNGLLHGEVAAEVEIRCRDCHGSATQKATLRTSGPAAPAGGNDLSLLRSGEQRRFEWRSGRLYQRLILPPHEERRVVQVVDTLTPGHPDYNAKATRSKTVAKGDPDRWGGSVRPEQRAHGDDLACFTCHSSHVAGDQMLQLGVHGEVKDSIVAPVRASSARLLVSAGASRDRTYSQQQRVSTAGYSGQAFAPLFPHTVRKTETKQCTDCHISAKNDNNAIMAQLLLLGTNFVNPVGFDVWVGTDASVAAIQVTESDEPQAVVGSYLHRYAYPDYYRQHLDRGRELASPTPVPLDAAPFWARSIRNSRSSRFPGIGPRLDDSVDRRESGQVGCLQLRGDYLYVAEGNRGMQAFEVSSIVNKGFFTAPLSLLRKKVRIRSRNATCVALPTTQLLRPERNRSAVKLRPEDLERFIHPIYSFAAVTDAEEGLILVNVETLGDSEPRNDFLERALTWNPDGLLTGARHAHFAGHVLYVSADAGIVILDLDEPLAPAVLAMIPLRSPRASMLQFRYLFAVDEDGLKVVDVTHPSRPRLVEQAFIPFTDAKQVFVSRKYAFVAAGAAGLAIVDVERPERPRLHTVYTAEGRLDDARDVVVATANESLFAYVADGRNGLKVLQLTSPELQPRFSGFSPAPNPRLIAWRNTEHPARSISRPLERDRAVDETGHQIAVFGQVGSRPFNLEEMQRLYLDDDGEVWTVDDLIRRKSGDAR